jgi:hypothetical protein
MEVIRSASRRLRLLASVLAISLAGVAALLIATSDAAAAPTVTDLGQGFPVSMNASDHVLIGRLTFEGEPEEEDLSGPWSIWADGKSTALEPLNGEGEEEGGFRHELELEQINAAGEAGGTSTINVVDGEEERSEDRPVIYSPSGVGREVALFQDTFTNEEDEEVPVGGLGFGLDDNGDVIGIGVRQIGGKLRGRGFFAPAGSAPEVVGEADAPEGPLWFSEIFEVNASGTMFGQLTTTEENEEEEGGGEIPTGTKYYLWETPSSPGIQLDFDEIVRGLANDGTVLGGRGGTLFMRTPDGKEVAVEGLDKPEAVNSAHQIVGSEIVKGAEHAAVWQSGKVTDLNTLLPENSGWVLQRAATINDSGDIAGVGLHEGHSAAFLMPAVKANEELEVTSVEDTTTGLDSGSILGGDTLKIKGSGFEVPEEGEAEVEIFQNGKSISSAVVTPISNSEIQVISPDLSALQSQVPDSADGLATDVRVKITAIENGKRHETISPSSLDGTGPDRYDAVIPKVTSVIDEGSGNDRGSILGGDTLKIKGSGFGAPEGGKTMVAFSLAGEQLGKAEASTVSAKEVTVPAPDLASFASKIPADKEGLPLDVTVITSSGAKEVKSKTVAGDAFEALLPKVDSVQDTDTKEPGGSILGGETLEIKGSGFNVPVGGSASVRFYLGGDPVKTVEVQQDETGETGEGVSPDTIFVTAPDLASLQNQLEEGQEGLPLDVVVVIKDAGGDEVLSPSNLTAKEGDPDLFIATIPVITSVTDETTKKADGSILGGDTLKIKGFSFNAPAGATVAVKFNLGGDTVKTVPVKTEDAGGSECGEGCEGEGETAKQTSTELSVETPNLASLAKQIPEGKEGLPLNLTVEIKTKTDTVESKSTFDGKGEDAFEALLPKVDSVQDTDTKEPGGSILGGETLEIKGSGFNVPVGGSASVRFYLGGDPVKTVEVQQDETGETGEGVSPDTIFVTAPDLSSLQSQIPEGQTKLVVDVRAVFFDKEGNEVGSPFTSADRFTLDTLGITSADSTAFTVGDSGTFAVTAQGAKPVTLKETGALPEGVNFEEIKEGDAELAGTPAEGSAGVYRFTITASNGTDPDATQNFTLTVRDVPGAPEGVTASAGVDSANVTWSPPSSDGESDIKSYVVTANPGGEAATVSGTSSSAVIKGLTAGTSYTFSVSAVNAVGEGQPGTSNSVVVTSTELEEEHEATSTQPDGSASTEPVSSPDGSTLAATGEGEGTLHVGVYSSDPVALLSDGSSYFDVSTSAGSKFASVNFKICGVEAGASVQWWDPATHAWQAASSQTAPAGEPPCVTVTVDSTTSPSLSDLDGTVFAVTAHQKSGEEETPVAHEPTKTPQGGTIGATGVAGVKTEGVPEISVAGPVKVKAGSIRVPLRCGPGSGQCARLTLRLTVTEHLHDHRVSAITAGGKTRELVIGQLKVTLTAGQSKIVTVSLNSAGRRLLKSHRRFKASLRVSAGHATVKEQTVTILRPAKA